MKTGLYSAYERVRGSLGARSDASSPRHVSSRRRQSAGSSRLGPARHRRVCQILCGQRHAVIATSDLQIDVDLVGVFGASGGGTTTVRALLEYPELFRVGVAIAGCYDHRDSIAYVLDKYQGPDPKRWPATNLAPLAGRLQGRLLLIWGELDDNVHPVSSMRMLNAFIEADVHVDVLVVPGADHFVSSHPYVRRRVAT